MPTDSTSRNATPWIFRMSSSDSTLGLPISDALAMGSAFICGDLSSALRG